MGNVDVMKVSGVALILCIAALGAPFGAMAAFTCCEVKPALEACGCYARNGGDVVPEQCCYEAINLRDQVTNSSLSQRIACNCILDVAKKDPNINASAFEIIPDRCGIRLPFHFSINMNCNNL